MFGQEYHASDKYKRKLDYDKGFNDDWTVEDAGDRIIEMTEKSKTSMEDPWQKLQRKLQKKSETSTADKVQKKAHDVKTVTKDTMDSVEGILKSCLTSASMITLLRRGCVSLPRNSLVKLMLKIPQMMLQNLQGHFSRTGGMCSMICSSLISPPKILMLRLHVLWTMWYLKSLMLCQHPLLILLHQHIIYLLWCRHLVLRDRKCHAI